MGSFDAKNRRRKSHAWAPLREKINAKGVKNKGKKGGRGVNGWGGNNIFGGGRGMVLGQKISPCFPAYETQKSNKFGKKWNTYSRAVLRFFYV